MCPVTSHPRRSDTASFLVLGRISVQMCCLQQLSDVQQFGACIFSTAMSTERCRAGTYSVRAAL